MCSIGCSLPELNILVGGAGTASTGHTAADTVVLLDCVHLARCLEPCVSCDLVCLVQTMEGLHSTTTLHGFCVAAKAAKHGTLFFFSADGNLMFIQMKGDDTSAFLYGF